VVRTTEDYEYELNTVSHQARLYLETLREKLVQQHYQITCDVRGGPAAECILEAAAAHHVDAIVMSTHGRSGFSRWVHGSVTNRVLSAAQFPIFVIPSIRAETVAEATLTDQVINKT